MAKLFLLLSGEHEDLPISEVKAILEAEGHPYQILEKLDQVTRLQANPKCVKALERRAAFTRICALESFACNSEIDKIIKAAQHAELEKLLKQGQSFAVRVRHVKEYSSKIDGMTLERTLGALILEKSLTATVNLKKPDRIFIGILTEEKFIFGVKLAEIKAKPFVERRPRRKPFFHPSAMQAKLARCMVNLAKPKAGETVLDPFCGTGTTLIEAKLIGCQALGLDIKRRMARGTLRNMAHFKVRPEGIIVADAKDPPLTRVDCVVTDPPYGISSTTLKRSTRQIVEELMRAVLELLSDGGRICMAAPKKLDITHLGKSLGYKCLESHLVYVHRSLTREITVFEKC